MNPTVADVSAVLNALQGRWLPVYQEIDGQMIPKSEFAANLLELTGTEFKVIKSGTIAYEGFFTINPLHSSHGSRSHLPEERPSQTFGVVRAPACFRSKATR